jgi:hypothetical protein
MSWIKTYIRRIRFALVGLLILAILGPWTFDFVNIPAFYPCTAPNIRLEGDFCGLPMSGGWFLLVFAVEIVNRIAGLFLGTSAYLDIKLLFYMIAFPLFILLPILSTTLISRRENNPRRQAFQIAVCAGLLAAFIISTRLFARLYWELWGTWLYIGVAAGALVLEVLAQVAQKRTARILTG